MAKFYANYVSDFPDTKKTHFRSDRRCFLFNNLFHLFLFTGQADL